MHILYWIFLLWSSKCLSSEAHSIGAIFYKGSDDMKTALEVSAAMNNFTPAIREVSRRGEILEISNHLCDLAKEGIIAIIDGTGGRASENVQAICDILEIPHIMLHHNDMYSQNWTVLNMAPSPEAYNLALQRVIEVKGWRNFTLLYTKGHGLLRVSELMHMGNNTTPYVVTVRELSGTDYREVLIDAKHNGYTKFVVDCPSRDIEQLLLHAQQVGLMAEEHSYIFLSPDLFTVELDRYRYGGVNMTGLRLIDLKKTIKLRRFATEAWPGIDPEKIKIDMLLIHDAVEVLAAAAKKIKYLKVEELSCENNDAWTYGSSLMNFMKTNRVEGITTSIVFDGMGQRNDVKFQFLELTPAGNETEANNEYIKTNIPLQVGTWQDYEFKVTRPARVEADIMEATVLRNRTLKVLIALTEPFAYMKNSPEKLSGNDQYEGFAIDLIDKLSVMLGFNYIYEVEKNYGGIDATTGKWTGMCLKLREDKADLAICDFTMTAQRQSGVDFSTPFMTLGIGILYKRPNKEPPAMFSFMEVFSKEVWYYMILIQMCLGVVLIFVGRISNKEWQNPVPCVEEPEELSNQFSFANSVWLIIGSVMQQGSEIAPIALAPRLITSVWWFFTMVMVASYVGTLVAFLTVEKNVQPFNTVEELYKQKSISYGAKDPGSTLQFFKESKNPMYKDMYNKMSSEGWLVGENSIGAKRAETNQYAFFMESSTIEYFVQRHCDLFQVGGLLDSKSYGIGMKKKSPLKKYIDDALLQLKERGEIDKLKTIWWNEKRGGGKCGAKSDDEQKQLGMKHMLGAFVVLGGGCAFGLVISILDMLWGVFKRSVKYQTTFKYELIEELKFVIRFSGNVKPVKRPSKATEGDGSTEALTKDEVSSLKSAGSVRSTGTHGSHSSGRHSPSSVSDVVAKKDR